MTTQTADTPLTFLPRRGERSRAGPQSGNGHLAMCAFQWIYKHNTGFRLRCSGGAGSRGMELLSERARERHEPLLKKMLPQINQHALIVPILLAMLDLARSNPRSVPKQAATSFAGKTYLVVGGHGFLGSHVVEALLHRGENSIRVLDRAPSSLFSAEIADGRVSFIHGDMLDPSCIKKACQGVDTVFHTAASVNFWSDLPFEHDRIYAVNVEGTENVIAACVENGVKQLLHTSSSSVVVPHDVMRRPLVLADESTPYPSAPFLCHYIKTKVEAEQRVRAANGQQGLLTAAVRPGGLYGPRDPLLTQAFAAGLPYAALPETIVDHIYVENVVHAFLLLEQRLVPGAPVCGQAYFVTNYPEPLPGGNDQGNERSCYEFSTRFAAAFGHRLRLAPQPLLSVLAWISQKVTWASRGRLERHMRGLAKLRPASLALSRGTYYFSHRKATADFGYQPLYSAAEGIEITARHFLRQMAHRA